MSSLYAIIRTSGRQYHVRKGTVIDVSPLSAKPGEELTLNDLLLIGDSDGGALQLDAKALQAAKVRAKILDHRRAPKLRVVKFRRRKNYRRTIGHRQPMTRLEIVGIERGESPAPAAEKATEPKAKPQADQTTGEQHGA